MTTAYLALDDELVVARGGTAGWRASRELVGRSPRCLAADADRPERVWCGTSGVGLWATADAGATWEARGERLATADLTSVAASPIERAGGSPVLYAGTEPSALFRSEDDGRTWRELTALTKLPSQPEWSFPPRPYTSHVRWITPDPHRPGTVYVCIEAGALVRSFDWGETWLDRVADGPFDTHTLAVHRLIPDRLWSAAGDGVFAPGRGFNVSRDRGETWERPDEGLGHHYLWSVALDPADPETLLVSGASSPRTAHDASQASATVYRRSAGSPWQEVRDGLPDPTGTTRAVLAASPAEPGAFYAASNRGLYRSADAGRTWDRLDLEWPDRYLSQAVGALVVTP
ncbi:MAG TPA: glycosyl hydrolase [Candidatus Dormibacteraeota bacterium]|nr:glycosyl hydrolase [Candidatus Dormibacteraeota bacterium]